MCSQDINIETNQETKKDPNYLIEGVDYVYTDFNGIQVRIHKTEKSANASWNFMKNLTSTYNTLFSKMNLSKSVS